MTPKTYEKIFIFNEAVRNAVGTLDELSQNRAFLRDELTLLATSIQELRSRTSAYLTGIVLAEERATALDLMQKCGCFEVPPYVC